MSAEVPPRAQDPAVRWIVRAESRITVETSSYLLEESRRLKEQAERLCLEAAFLRSPGGETLVQG